MKVAKLSLITAKCCVKIATGENQGSEKIATYFLLKMLDEKEILKSMQKSVEKALKIKKHWVIMLWCYQKQQVKNSCQ
jgi:hypothetical protein